MEAFNNFKDAHTCKNTMKAFNDVKAQFGLTDSTPHKQFFEQLCYGLCKLNVWKVKQFLEGLKKRFTAQEFKNTNKDHKTKVLVVGAGPCGLRIAIEAAFLGCKVVVVDKRTSFTRNNVLHLWPFTVTDLKNIGIKFFFAQFCCGELDHISIRRLQLCLLKVALTVGVDVQLGVTYKGLRLPKTPLGSNWGCSCDPPNHIVNMYNFDVLVAATGSRDVLIEYEMYNDEKLVTTRQGFERKEFKGKLSIAITANFVNSNTKSEMKIKELGGIASHFHQKLFTDLKVKYGIHLENIVYFRDETHYFVMTAKKESLLKRGVLINGNLEDPTTLLDRTNVNLQALLDYTRDAANHCTNNGMANIQFAKNSQGRDDVTMFDFSSKLESVNSSRVIERNGKQLLLCLVGDSLIEPFWPQGTGCARGFLGAFDAAWMIKNLKINKRKALDVIAERESVYKILSTTTSDNIRKEYSKFTIDPKTRYKSINMKAILPKDAVKFFDILDDDELFVDAMEASPRKKLKQSEDAIDLDDVLLWCQKVLSNYKEFEIVNLSTSWRSGCELGMLIHTFQPDIINIVDLNPTDPIRTTNIVVGVAQSQLGIYPIMTVSEMVNCSTKREDTMAMYLTQFYVFYKNLPIPSINDQPKEPCQTDENGHVGNDVEIDAGGRTPLADVTRALDEQKPCVDIDAIDSTRSRMTDENDDTSKTRENAMEVVISAKKDTRNTTNTGKDLEKRNVPVTKPRVSRVSLPIKQEKENRSDHCYICKEIVFALEKINVEDVFCHRSCLRCTQCYCHLNLNDYRLQKSSRGEKIFYCPKHAGPRSRFTQSIKKRPTGFGMQKLNAQHQYRKVEFNMGKAATNQEREKPIIPPRPDFLARRVTPGSIRRTEFYNTADDDKESETEDKIFEHNFGASIRKGLGAFSVYTLDSDEENQPSSDSDSNENIGEKLETVVDMGMHMDVDLSKNLTIKDAKSLWQTLKRSTAIQTNVIRHLTEKSGDEDNDEEENDTGTSIAEYAVIAEEQEEAIQDMNQTIKSGDLTKEKDLSEKPTVDFRKLSQGLEGNVRFEQAVKDLNRESQELSDKRYSNFSATCYRPNRKQINHDNTNKGDNVQLRRPKLRRCDSDESDIRHAQRVQMAARKLAIQRRQDKMYMVQELKRQLEEAEQALLEVEKEGVDVEKALKESTETRVEDKPELQRKLCSLYCRRQKLLEYEAELISASEQLLLVDKENDKIKCISNPTNESSSEEEEPFERRSMNDVQKFIAPTNSPGVSEEDIDSTDKRRVLPRHKDNYESAADCKSTAMQPFDNPDGTLGIPSESLNLTPVTTDLLVTPTSDETMSSNSVIAFDASYRNFESDVDKSIRIPDIKMIPESKLNDTNDCEGITPDSTEQPSKPEEIVPTGDVLAENFQEVLTFHETNSFWECPFCTLHNNDTSSFCDACIAWKCGLCTYVNLFRKKKCEMCFTDRPQQDNVQSGQSRESRA